MLQILSVKSDRTEKLPLIGFLLLKALPLTGYLPLKAVPLIGVRLYHDSSD
jgi:hypothetical protein